MEGTAMYVTRLDAWVSTVVCCFVMSGRRCRQRQKEYADKYRQMVESATEQVERIVRAFVKHETWKEIAVVDDAIDDRRWKEVVVEQN